MRFFGYKTIDSRDQYFQDLFKYFDEYKKILKLLKRILFFYSNEAVFPQGVINQIKKYESEVLKKFQIDRFMLISILTLHARQNISKFHPQFSKMVNSELLALSQSS